MSFMTKLWKDMVAEHPNRRTITDISSGTETTVDVARDVGTVSVIGDAFSASNMNDLETRISNEFTAQGADIAQNASDITELTENLTRINTYSTSEIDTGKKWIDGKTIYRKCYATTIATAKLYTDIDSTFASLVDNVIKLDGFIKTAYGIYPVPMVYDSADISNCGQLAVFNNGHGLAYFGGNTSDKTGTLVVTVEYTKA